MSDELQPVKLSDEAVKVAEDLLNSKISVNDARKALRITKRPPFDYDLVPLRDDPNYTRQVNEEDGSEIGDLGLDCGPHCGVHMAGTHKILGHHECRLCHPKKGDATP